MPPIVIAAGIGAAGALGGAAIASSGAKGAAQTQKEAGDKALELQRQMYEQQRADIEPWRNVGGQAITTLGALSGLPSGPVASSAPATGTLGAVGRGPRPGQAGWTPAVNLRNLAERKVQDVPDYVYDGGSPRPVGAGMTPAAAQSASSYQPMVRVKAPTGEVGMVPESELQRALSMGAVRI